MISPKYAIYVLSLQDAFWGEDHCSPPLLGSVQQQAHSSGSLSNRTNEPDPVVCMIS